ncbi:hypothetical protein DUQ00_09950 [Salmonella bongori]|uniref:Uncharacterized protein n=2 Tax=Salmonella bongori TaxID=54736 RepID=A0A248K5W7_SALBN|nr:hypothetical protein LFZ56_04670 [Salmonella bongori serovar 66:z41:- str. SA19983605]ECC8732958.1 hypothetical protein [Salmonella bongori]ECG8261265.1 hypothetical protein [Salmonella bongori serovar 48:i:-]EGE4653944.1 hypothetical protein [Salmonella bongori serovar 40:z35:- str. 95-0123]EGE4660826.1 hypothetical protein [Salmonella bongori serovar 48:i:- str. 94-0708]TNB53346.1 hypothetical protein FGW25_03800 [Salmonella bongori serovar 48:z35:-]
MVSASASTRSTFGRSFRALRESLAIDSSLFVLPDGATLIRPTFMPGRMTPSGVIPRNPARDQAPGERCPHAP